MKNGALSLRYTSCSPQNPRRVLRLSSSIMTIFFLTYPLTVAAATPEGFVLNTKCRPYNMFSVQKVVGGLLVLHRSVVLATCTPHDSWLYYSIFSLPFFLSFFFLIKNNNDNNSEKLMLGLHEKKWQMFPNVQMLQHPGVDTVTAPTPNRSHF